MASYGVPHRLHWHKFVEIDTKFGKIRPKITVRNSLGRSIDTSPTQHETNHCRRTTGKDTYSVNQMKEQKPIHTDVPGTRANNFYQLCLIYPSRRVRDFCLALVSDGCADRVVELRATFPLSHAPPPGRKAHFHLLITQWNIDVIFLGMCSIKAFMYCQQT